MDEYKARKVARERLATNEEIEYKVQEADAHQEVWMYGCMALALHRRYHWQSETILRVFEDIRNLHNEIYETYQSHDQTSAEIIRLVWEEVGLGLAGELQNASILHIPDD